MELGVLVFAGLLTFSALSTNVAKKTVDENPTGTLDEVATFFEANISSMRLAYEQEFKKDWNVKRVENMAYLFEKNSKEQLGYVVEFDAGVCFLFL